MRLGFVSRRNPEVFAPVQSSGWRHKRLWPRQSLHHSMNEGWAHLHSRSGADSCATGRAHTVGSRENVCLSQRTPPAVMHTSRFVNGRGLLTCKRKHLSGLAKFFCFGFPSTRHKSIIRIQKRGGLFSVRGWQSRRSD